MCDCADPIQCVGTYAVAQPKLWMTFNAITVAISRNPRQAHVTTIGLRNFYSLIQFPGRAASLNTNV